MNDEYEDMIAVSEAKARIERMAAELMSFPKRDRIGAVIELMTVLIHVIGDTYGEEVDT